MTRVQHIHRIIGLVAALALPGCAQTANSTEPSAADTPQLKAFRDSGKAASMTVLPTNLAGRPVAKVGEVVAMLLEKAGMTNLQTSDAEFRPAVDADLATTAAAFGEFVKGHPVETDYVLYTEFIASPQHKFTEVRTIVVTKSGEIVWSDAQTRRDAAFKKIKPAEPMQCCLLVAERLRPTLNLDDPTRANAPEGKIARKWESDTGVPDKAEQEAMTKRLGILKKTAAASTLLVYPVHAGDALNSDSATALVAMINKAGLAKASAAPHIEKFAVQPNMNEQKVLWGMARAFRDFVRKAKPDADYVLYADYLMGKDNVGAAHFAICDRQGEWVLVDFQNSHHKDFQAIKPATREDCDRLVLKRLTGYCK
ncbi:MAG: hypothetical protein HZA51_00665 [Planctomycetes bacterium]|nr:hypothetical protein [Planctomycetota bacterium]